MRIRTIDVKSWLAVAVSRIETNNENSLLDAQVIAAHGLCQSRTWIVSHPEYQLTPPETKILDNYLNRLIDKEPLAYIIGHREFYSLDFFVAPAVLIPRPETELLVEEALKWLTYHPDRRISADIGTGSGCIAISLAERVTNLQVFASDISLSALRVACRNRTRYYLSRRIHFVQANLLDPFCIQFDLICANLPYIPSKYLKTLIVSRYEPHLALDGGENGFEIIRNLMKISARSLAPGGLILLEIEANQGDLAASCASQYFPKAFINVVNDLAENPRMVRIQT